MCVCVCVCVFCYEKEALTPWVTLRKKLFSYPRSTAGAIIASLPIRTNYIGQSYDTFIFLVKLHNL